MNALNVCLLFVIGLHQGAEPEHVSLTLESLPNIRCSFAGVVEPRVSSNIHRWLLDAPLANPGLIEMFRVRDRAPVPQIVPWAGEFVGKYLISAVQALRMTDDPRLEQTVRLVIDDLLSTQAEDGYLGPFRREERLLGHWDLWGHYHVMTALLMWHERTGDERALAACQKAGDLVCATYLNAPRRVVDAGSPEMNMAIITSLGWLYRVTGEAKYQAMMKEVLADFEKEGDYYRAGLANTDFYRTPRPRWESLHCVQGLVELYRITGDEKYKTAFLNLWRSIRDWDLRNTGGFSSGEQATGNPYEDSAIETCCSIAWMALSIDALRLSGDPHVADVIERGFYNAILGAQHPSGRWWTYNTPMNGIREASAHTIVFQSRAGTPELNCCSVNAPRGLGMLSEWGVMRGKDEIVINYLGPMNVVVPIGDANEMRLEVGGDYPIGSSIAIKVTPKRPVKQGIAIRIPAFAVKPTVRVSGGAAVDVSPGTYWRRVAEWKAGDEINLSFEMPLRAQVGDLEQEGKVSIYRGPVLLAYDQTLNPFDEAEIPVIDLASLESAKIDSTPGSDHQWITVTLGSGDQKLVLGDFASVGAQGTRYRSWLAAQPLGPPKPMAIAPADNAKVPPGSFPLTWRAIPTAAIGKRTLTLEVATDADFKSIVGRHDSIESDRFVLPAATADKLKPGTTYFWRLIAEGTGGQQATSAARRFTVDGSLPRLKPDELTEFGEREDGVIVEADLAGSADPAYGTLLEGKNVPPASGPNESAHSGVELTGQESRLIYQVKRFPEIDYSASVWVNLTQTPERLAQIVSAWGRSGDDPLRICVEGENIFVRIEGSGGASSAGHPLPIGKWVHVAAVKDDGKLTLYLDGAPVTTTGAPRRVLSASKAIAVGRNPVYSGDESLPGRYARFRFFARALSPDEVAQLANER